MNPMIIFHHNDLDGRCSAAIMVRYAKEHDIPILKCVELDYKETVPVEDIPPNATVAIVDFSFKPDTMKAVEQRAARIIWCDHHVTAKNYGYHFDGYQDFSDKGLAGCECTWKFCFPNERIPYAALLIGDYDAWRLKEQPTCFEFYEGMKLRPQNPLAVEWQALFSLDSIGEEREIISDGSVCIQYRDAYCAEIATAFGYEIELDGHHAFAMNLYRFGSKQFGGKFHQYPVCVAYIHDGTKFTVSLFSEAVDVSAIAKNHGGGGHRGAAGFTCKTLPWA